MSVSRLESDALSSSAMRFVGIVTRSAVVIVGVELILLAVFELLWPTVQSWHHLSLDVLATTAGVSAVMYWTYLRPLDTQLTTTLHELDFARRQAELLSQRDPLTGLLNRREFFGRMEEEWQRSERHELALSCIMLDLDDFKQVNDEHGHLVGDAAIRGAGKVLMRKLRSFDISCRYGGEEFIVLLPETHLAKAVALAERLRVEIEGMKIPLVAGETLQLAASFGVAEKTLSVGGVEGLIELADKAMLKAKQTGKNRVEVLQSEGRLAEFLSPRNSLFNLLLAPLSYFFAFVG